MPEQKRMAWWFTLIVIGVPVWLGLMYFGLWLLMMGLRLVGADI